jgi:hypothetical protein
MGGRAAAKERKRRAWFAAGARAAARLSLTDPAGPPAYLCPLCRRAFDGAMLAAGALTLEHVPPDALGGRHLVLTCADCNKTAGATLDREMQAVERLLDFGQGTLAEPAPVQLTFGDLVLHADLVATGDDVTATVVPPANHPDIRELLDAEFGCRRREGRWEGSTFTVGFDRPSSCSPRLAALGWLRAAYLVAFAAYGYRYAFSPKLSPVRHQLAHPDIEHIGAFGRDLAQVGRDDRRLLLVREPAPFRSLLVQMGRHVIFLPRLDDTGDLYQRLAAACAPGRVLPPILTGTPIPWPSWPGHALD